MRGRNEAMSSVKDRVDNEANSEAKKKLARFFVSDKHMTWPWTCHTLFLAAEVA
jgi:hypothetical protein